jgi:hypothetical protein
MSTGPRVALPAKKRIRRGRRLVLIDIENLAGTADLGPRTVAAWHDDLVANGLIRSRDQIVLAGSHHAMQVAAFAWPGHPLRKVRSGPDGADLALLNLLDDTVGQRFDSVVIVSGDGIFTSSVAPLMRQGVVVTVAARTETLSARLRLAATQVVFLSDLLHADEKVSA